MTRFLVALIFGLVLLAPSLALACEGGDQQKGPVCVHERAVKVGSFYRTKSRVYFEESPRIVIWASTGYVKRATTEHLWALQPSWQDGVGVVWRTVRYDWDPSVWRYK